MRETAAMTLAEFLLARIAEEMPVRLVDEEIEPGDARSPYYVSTYRHAGTCASVGSSEYADCDCNGAARTIAECEARRRIVELHKSWPVLVQSPPAFESVDSADPDRIAMRASQQIAWLTEQEYRERFGDEPPTAPMLRALAAIYADHEDFQEEWRP